jgi:hypothetical protein
MTKIGKVTAAIFIVISFLVTALTGLNGNLIAMGGWLIATVLVVVICVNAEDHAEQLLAAEKGDGVHYDNLTHDIQLGNGIDSKSITTREEWRRKQWT